MERIRRIWKRVRVIFLRRQFDDELVEEINGHIERLIDENLKAGMSSREARIQATRRFGNRTIMQEQSKEVWLYRAIETIVQDLKYGLRMVARTPAFAAVVVLSLALGIGANTAIFTVVNSLMLKALPVKDPGRLVNVELADYKIGDFTVSALSYPAYAKLRDGNQVFDGLLADGAGGTQQLVMTGPGTSGQVETATITLVSGNYFSTLGVPAIIGRTITGEDDKAGASQPVVILSYDYWKRRFQRDPSVIGKTFALADSEFAVIGVAPAGFFGTQVGAAADMFAPLAVQPLLAHGESRLDQSGSYWLSMMGRLKPGTTIGQAQADSMVVYQQVLADMASDIKDEQSRARFLKQHLKVSQGQKGETSWRREELATSLTILMGIVLAVLLIACANIANLMLARGSARRKEISVRLALGAGRVRLIRQLVTESLILAAFGGGLGFFLASIGSRILVYLVSTESSPLLLDTHTDPGVLAFTAGVSMLTVLLFGVAPAIRATRVGIGPALNERTGSSSAPTHRLGKALAAAQVAVSLVLLMGGGLFARTLQKLSDVDAGFDRAHLYQVSWDAFGTGYKDQQLAALFDETTKRVSQTPGVLSVSLSATGLFSRTFQFGPLIVEGSSAADQVQDETCHYDLVGTSFFETTGMTVKRGRGFGAQDTTSSPKIAVINEAAARRYFGETDPIGKRIFTNYDRKSPIEVVGIVKDAKYEDLRSPSPAMLYRPYFQGETTDSSNLRSISQMEVRALGEPGSLISAIRNEIYSIDKNLKVEEINQVGRLVDDSVSQERAIAALSGFFSFLSLLLVALGLYGLMSYSVSQRIPEVGIRMAMGAKARDIEKMIIREMLAVLAIGIPVGLLAAFAATRAISTLLFGVSPLDPISLITATIVIAIACVAAGLLPARRAARVDPMTALRYE